MLDSGPKPASRKNMRLKYKLLVQMNVTYKIGLVYCKAGQKTEEEMYNNGESLTKGNEQLLLFKF